MAKRRCVPALVATLAATLAILTGCEPPEEAARPDESEVRSLIMRALGEGRADPIPPELLAVVDASGEVLRYVPAPEEEREALWRPPAFEAISIEEMRCQFFPVWRVAYRPTLDVREAGVLISEVVPVDGELRLLVRWREAREGPGGTLVPDFSPHAHGRAENLEGRPKVTVIAQTIWTDLRIDR